MGKQKIKYLFIFIFLSGIVTYLVFSYYFQFQSSEEVLRNQREVRTSAGLVPSYTSENIVELNDRNYREYSKNFHKLKTSGQLVIPDVGINVNIYEGINEEHLAAGAGEQLPRSQVKNGGYGNYILASHRYRNNPHLLFSNLYNAKAGMKIYTIDEENMYTYDIIWTERVHETETTPLNEVGENQKLITLYTCYGSLEHRYVVRGELIAEKPLKDITENELDMFMYSGTELISFAEYTLNKN